MSESTAIDCLPYYDTFEELDRAQAMKLVEQEMKTFAAKDYLEDHPIATIEFSVRGKLELIYYYYFLFFKYLPAAIFSLIYRCAFINDDIYIFYFANCLVVVVTYKSNRNTAQPSRRCGRQWKGVAITACLIWICYVIQCRQLRAMISSLGTAQYSTHRPRSNTSLTDLRTWSC